MNHFHGHSWRWLQQPFYPSLDLGVVLHQQQAGNGPIDGLRDLDHESRRCMALAAIGPLLLKRIQIALRLSLTTDAVWRRTRRPFHGGSGPSWSLPEEEHPERR